DWSSDVCSSDLQDAVPSVPRGVPQSLHVRVRADDGTAIAGHGPEPRPHALHGVIEQRWEETDGSPEDLGEALVGDATIEAGVLHGRTEHGFTAAGEHVAAIVIQNRRRSIRGPGGGGQLPA